MSRRRATRRACGRALQLVEELHEVAFRFEPLTQLGEVVGERLSLPGGAQQPTYRIMMRGLWADGACRPPTSVF